VAHLKLSTSRSSFRAVIEIFLTLKAERGQGRAFVLVGRGLLAATHPCGPARAGLSSTEAGGLCAAGVPLAWGVGPSERGLGRRFW